MASTDFSKKEVTNFTIEFTLMHALRVPAVFHAARAELQPEYFGTVGETPHRLIWAATLDYWERQNELPTYNALAMRVLSTLEKTPGTIPEALTAADAIMRWMYSKEINPDDELTPGEAMNTLREILMERTVDFSLRQAVYNAGDGKIHNLPKLLERVQQQTETISALGAVSEADTMPETWAEAGRPMWPTGVPFMDRVMEGGSEPGHVNVIIGATGGGKTTLAMQMCVSIARLQREMAKPENPGEPGIVVFVSYEDDLRMMQIRAASNAARVQKNRLRFLKSDKDLSTKGNLEEYEQHMYRCDKQTDNLIGEAERLEEVRPWLNKYVKFVDFHDGSSGGSGNVPEVRHRLLALQDKHGMPIRSVFMDWAGLMIRNYLIKDRGAVEGGSMSLELGGLVGRAKAEIATPFDCTVWIPHQLRGQACKRPPATVPHHAEAEWCASFANMAWYAFCLGTKDEEHNVIQISATKTRHGEPVPPVICRIDGNMCRLTDVSETFTRDSVSHRLMPARDVAAYHEGLSTVAPDVQAQINKGLT